jgi:hypothetical protein
MINTCISYVLYNLKHNFSSASFPDGNQVDGLPSAVHWCVSVVGAPKHHDKRKRAESLVKAREIMAEKRAREKESTEISASAPMSSDPASSQRAAEVVAQSAFCDAHEVESDDLRVCDTDLKLHDESQCEHIALRFLDADDEFDAFAECDAVLKVNETAQRLPDADDSDCEIVGGPRYVMQIANPNESSIILSGDALRFVMQFQVCITYTQVIAFNFMSITECRLRDNLGCALR